MTAVGKLCTARARWRVEAVEGPYEDSFRIMSSANLPNWLPPSAQDIQEDLAQATLRKIQRCTVHVPLMQRSLQTAFLATASANAGTGT